MLAGKVLLLRNESILGLEEKICATVHMWPSRFYDFSVGIISNIVIKFFIYCWIKIV